MKRFFHDFATTGIVLFIFAACMVLTASILYLVGGREFVSHLGENHWQTWVCALVPAAIVGVASGLFCRLQRRKPKDGD